MQKIFTFSKNSHYLIIFHPLGGWGFQYFEALCVMFIVRGFVVCVAFLIPKIRRSIFEETGCTASAGASTNMLLARCAHGAEQSLLSSDHVVK